MLHSGYHQPDTKLVHDQFDRLIDTPGETVPTVAKHLEGNPDRHLGHHCVPQGDLVQQPQRETQPGNPPPYQRRRNLPRPPRAIGLLGAVLTEWHDDWTEARRYLSLDVPGRK
jgi:putative transposase